MPLTLLDDTVDQLADNLSAWKLIDKTEAVRIALETELRRMEDLRQLRERIRPIQDRFAARPSTGFEPDKAFYDELSGDIWCLSI